MLAELVGAVAIQARAHLVTREALILAPTLVGLPILITARIRVLWSCRWSCRSPVDGVSPEVVEPVVSATHCDSRVVAG